MIEHFVYLFLLHWWLMCLIYKITELDKGDNEFIAWASRLKNKFLRWFWYELFTCRFCIESHVGMILSIPLAYEFNNISLLLFGWMSAALCNIINRA